MADYKLLITFYLFLKVLLYPFYKCLCFVIGLLRRNKEQDYSCNIVLVTGAAQGIGKALANEFARRGATLVLWDIDEEKLMETRTQLLSSQGPEVFAYVVDCSKSDQVYRTAEKVKEEVGNVSVLVNNAGTMMGKSVLELEDKDIEKSIGINVLAHFWTIRAFLPWMIDNNYGHIVEICSMAGFTGIPKASEYCASKGALLGLAHSLRMELMMQKKMGVAVTCVFPSAVDTELSKIIHSIPNKMEPRECAVKMMAAIRSKPFMVSIGSSGYRLAAVQRFILPTSINDELFKLYVGGRSMDDLISNKED